MNAHNRYRYSHNNSLTYTNWTNGDTKSKGVTITDESSIVCVLVHPESISELRALTKSGTNYVEIFEDDPFFGTHWIEAVYIIKKRKQSNPQSTGGRIDLQGERVITQMVDKFSEIHRNKGINPYSGNNYHVSDIVDASSLPEKHWFNKIFGSMTNDGAKGTSYFGDKAAQWYLVDRNFINNYSENYISYIYGDHPGGDMYRIRAMYNNETIISLIFYDYDLYQTMYNRIFK